MKKNDSKTQQLTPKEFGVKMNGITPQAVMKKIHNTLVNAQNGNAAKSNALPAGVTVEQFGRVYIIHVPDGFKFPRPSKAKAKKQ